MIQVRAGMWQPGKDVPNNVRIAITTQDRTTAPTEFDLDRYCQGPSIERHSMWLELIVAFALIVASVVIHGLGTFFLIRWSHPLVQNIHSLAFTGGLWLMLRFFLALVTLHFLEGAVWAEFYFMQHCFPDRETAYYFSLESYTTVGYGNIVISHPWRLMGTLEAISGVLFFGWSTALLVGFFSRLLEIRRESFKD